MKKRLLLADDEESSRVTLEALLEDTFLVDAVASFKEAERKLEGGAGSYDVVVLDHHLGDGLGASLVPKVREGSPRAIVILVTGSSPDDLPENCADGCFVKGSSLDALFRLIDMGRSD
jgi:DNA-binding NtrC family response regulator